MLKTTNTQLQSIKLQFTDQNNRPLETEDKGKYCTTNWVGLVKLRYSTEQKYRKFVTGYDFLSFARKFGDKYGKMLMNTATKTGIDAAKITSKRVVPKLKKLQEV